MPGRFPRSFERVGDGCEHRKWAYGILPHATQNLCALRPLLEAAFDDRSPACLLASAESVIVIMADGVALDVARARWSPSRLSTLTSTVPSTSSTALLSAATGLAPAAHGVIGVCFRVAEIDALFDCYRDAAIAAKRDTTVDATSFALGPWQTVFSVLNGRVECVAHAGALATTPGRWYRALVHGARDVPSSIDWDTIALDPIAMVTASVAEVNAALEARGSAPLLVWAHINVDSAIHATGYSDAVLDAMSALDEAAHRWASAGHSVMAYSDHGLVPTRDSDRARRLLALLQDRAHVSCGSGGAGRVLWAYPRPGSTSELLERARDLAAGIAGVVHRDELFLAGALADTPLARERVGEVVVIATGEEFPLFVPSYRFEHGGCSEQEMIVPVATWMGR